MFKKKSVIDEVLSSLEERYRLKKERSVLEIVFETMHQEILKDPWMFLGKVAIGSFGLGVALGQRGPFRKKGNK